MCGIAGVIGIETDIIENILGQIEHRGWTGYLYETKEIKEFGVCLGTNRLPIVSPENNKQPALSSNENIVLVMNAQIFNFKELAIEYDLKFLIDSDASDTRFLAEFIEKFGIDFVLKKINWEGAFIYLNKSSGEIIFVRDHLGIRPLYYSFWNKNFLLSSEIKGFRDNNCSNVFTVLPGTINIYNLKNRKIKKQHWWFLHKNSQQRNLMNVVVNSIESRVPENNYAVLLSGGLDSSIVISIAKNVNKNVVAYTLGTKDSIDLEYSRKLCEIYNIPLIEVEADSSDKLKEKIPRIVDITETWEWQVINHAAPMDKLLKKVRLDGNKVILTGEGADELFFGYESYYNKEGKEKERKKRILDLHKTNCRRLDRMCMAHGLECRVPFLDKTLVELALSYKYEECVSDSSNKIPLRNIGEQLLPSGFSNRKKMSLSKGAGYKYGINEKNKNVFGIIINEYEMKNKQYVNMARYPIEKYLIDIAYEKGFLSAKYLLEASV